ncbi:MAG: hypothetical protein ACRDWY_16205 [Actinomycetes bacterium]
MSKDLRQQGRIELLDIWPTGDLSEVRQERGVHMVRIVVLLVTAEAAAL